MAVRVVFIVGFLIPFVTVFGSAPERLTCEQNFPVTSWLKVKLCLRLSLSDGWTLASAFTVPSFQYLDALPKDASFLPRVSHASIIDAFTDGSCLHPADPALRHAAFSVVLSDPYRLDYDHSWFHPPVAQPLSGVLQTVYRAELSAIISALQFAVQRQCCVRIWTDCLNVIKVFQAHVIDGIRVRPNEKNADLLLAFVDLAQQLGRTRLAILKVAAHVDRLAYANDGGW